MLNVFDFSSEVVCKKIDGYLSAEKTAIFEEALAIYNEGLFVGNSKKSTIFLGFLFRFTVEACNNDKYPELKEKIAKWDAAYERFGPCFATINGIFDLPGMNALPKMDCWAGWPNRITSMADSHAMYWQIFFSHNR